MCFAQGLAAELAPQTRVNAIAPGFVPTHFADFLVQNAAAVCSLTTIVHHFFILAITDGSMYGVQKFVRN